MQVGFAEGGRGARVQQVGAATERPTSVVGVGDGVAVAWAWDEDHHVYAELNLLQSGLSSGATVQVGRTTS